MGPMAESTKDHGRTTWLARVAPWLLVGGLVLFHAINNWAWLVENVTSTGWDTSRHLAFSLLFEPVWANSYLRVRTGLALFALLAVPTALVILDPPFGRRWVRRLSRGLLLSLTGLWLAVAVGAAARQQLSTLRPSLGLESERSYLIRVLSEKNGFYSYEDFEYINQYTPQDSVIFIRDFVSYYLDRAYVLQGGVFWGLLPPDVYGDPAQLRTALDDMRVTHFVIRNGWLAEPEHNKERFQKLASVLETMPGAHLLRESEYNKLYVLGE